MRQDTYFSILFITCFIRLVINLHQFSFVSFAKYSVFVENYYAELHKTILAIYRVILNVNCFSS